MEEIKNKDNENSVQKQKFMPIRSIEILEAMGWKIPSQSVQSSLKKSTYYSKELVKSETSPETRKRNVRKQLWTVEKTENKERRGTIMKPLKENVRQTLYNKPTIPKTYFTKNKENVIKETLSLMNMEESSNKLKLKRSLFAMPSSKPDIKSNQRKTSSQFHFAQPVPKYNPSKTISTVSKHIPSLNISTASKHIPTKTISTTSSKTSNISTTASSKRISSITTKINYSNYDKSDNNSSKSNSTIKEECEEDNKESFALIKKTHEELIILRQEVSEINLMLKNFFSCAKCICGTATSVSKPSPEKDVCNKNQPENSWKKIDSKQILCSQEKSEQNSALFSFDFMTKFHSDNKKISTINENISVEKEIKLLPELKKDIVLEMNNLLLENKLDNKIDDLISPKKLNLELKNSSPFSNTACPEVKTLENEQFPYLKSNNVLELCKLDNISPKSDDIMNGTTNIETVENQKHLNLKMKKTWISQFEMLENRLKTGSNDTIYLSSSDGDSPMLPINIEKFLNDSSIKSISPLRKSSSTSTIEKKSYKDTDICKTKSCSDMSRTSSQLDIYSESICVYNEIRDDVKFLCTPLTNKHKSIATPNIPKSQSKIISRRVQQQLLLLNQDS